MNENFLDIEITTKNMYVLLSDYLDFILNKVQRTEDEFIDICFAICASDENIGTSSLKHDNNTQYGVSENDIWQRIVNQCKISNLKSSIEQLPRVQKERIIVDAMIMCLKLSNYDFRCSYNSKASKVVSSILGVKDITFTLDDKDEGDITESLRIIQSLFHSDLEGKDALRELSRYNALLSELCDKRDTTMYFGVLNIDTWYQSVKKMPFYSADVSSLTDSEKAFANTYFSIVDDISCRETFAKEIEEYKKYWMQEVVRLTFMVAEEAYKESPSITINKLEELQPLAPIYGVNIYEDGLVADKLMQIFVNGSYKEFKDDDMNKVLTIISVLVNKRPVTIAELLKGGKKYE